MTETTRKATIYDIARLSGSSPSTVSAALGGAWRKRRISQAKVEFIRGIAAEQGYSTNMQARGLRQARSGLVGMLIPVHDNRFFSSLSQSFDAFARERGLVPVIASFLRDPDEERRIVESLISYSVDYLFVAGSTNPDVVSDLCNQARMKHVFVDLPGSRAPSVVSDNYRGSAELTRKLLDEMPHLSDPLRGRPYFLGGSFSDHATGRRLAAFRDTITSAGYDLSDDQMIPCGYTPRSATRAIRDLCERIGGLPAALFVNSIKPFEGVLGHFVTLPPEVFVDCVVGCYDYDPFAAYLQFPVHMVRQDAHALISKAFELVESGREEPVLVQIEPELIPPRTIYKGHFGDLG